MLFKSLLVLAAATLAFSPAKAQNTTANLADVLQTNGQTSQLFSKINGTYPSILALLQGNNSNATYTVFAPADSAFTPQVIALLPTIGDLQDLLLYHVVNGTYPSTNLKDGPNILDSVVNNGSLLRWSNGTGLALDVEKGPAGSSPTTDSSSTSTGSAHAAPTAGADTGITVRYGIGSANVIQADIKASNGIIYIIDTILGLPESPSLTAKSSGAQGQLNQFSESLNQTGLVHTVDGSNGITIFAPSDSAFSHTNLTDLSNDTLVKIMKYHVINQVLYSTNLTGLTGPTNFTTAEGDNITITVSGNDITVGNYNTTGKVTIANIITDNGVIHVIDTVLFPINVTNGSSNNNGTSNAAPASNAYSPALLLSAVAIVGSFFL